MKTLSLISLVALSGCTSVTVEEAHVESATFNSAIYRAIAGTGKDATMAPRNPIGFISPHVNVEADVASENKETPKD